MIQYFLENGIDIRKDALLDCIMALTKDAKYFANYPPTEILILLILL